MTVDPGVGARKCSLLKAPFVTWCDGLVKLKLLTNVSVKGGLGIPSLVRSDSSVPLNQS